MPVLTVKGMPGDIDPKHLESLAARLGLLTGTLLGLPINKVSIFFPVDLLQTGLGAELICIVDGLFDKPERTREVRQRMAGDINAGLKYFAVHYLPQCGKVEVIVNRWNQDTDGFSTCNPNPL